MADFLSYTTNAPISDVVGGTDYELDSLSFVGNTTVVCLVLAHFVGVYLHDLDFDGNLGCILLDDCSGEIRIEDIRARDTGNKTDGGGDIGSGKSNVIQFIDSRTGGGSSGIRRVIIFGGQTEDMISIFGDSGGTDAGNPLIIEDCHLQSPMTDVSQAHTYASGSGSGIMTADASGSPYPSFVLCQNNTLLDAGQCLIQNYAGSNIVITNNVLCSQGKLRSNAGIYTPWTGGPFGGGAGISVTDNEVSDNRILFTTNLNGNRIFAGGTYYPSGQSTTHADIFDGGDSTPNPVTGISPQTNTLEDATIFTADLSIDPDTMVFGPSGPLVSTVSPSNGTTAGGNTVTVSGSMFTSATSVLFGDTAATSFTVDDDSTITATAPAHAAGTVAIVVS